MSKPEPLVEGEYYHIYNRGNNGEVLFREDRNYPYFLRLYAKCVEPVADTYAYCLMSNHFHFLVRIQDRRSSEDYRSFPATDSRSLEASQAFGNLFSTYTKAFNKAYRRTGALFERPFRRIVVDNDRYFAALVTYIHRNPRKHGFAGDFRTWPYSSYRAILSDQPTRLRRHDVLAWFDGQAGFVTMHGRSEADAAIEPLIAGDFL